MKKSGLKLLIIILIILIIGVVVYIKIVPQEENLFSKFFTNKNDEKNDTQIDTKNGVYVYKESLSKNYIISTSCTISSLDKYIVVINKDYFTYYSTCMGTFFDTKGNTDELEFYKELGSNNYSLKYNEEEYKKDYYKKSFVETTKDEQAKIVKSIDLKNLKFILSKAKKENHYYNINSNINKASGNYKLNINFDQTPYVINIYAGKVLKYSYEANDVEDFPKLYVINTDYIAIIEQDGKRSVLKIINSDKKTIQFEYLSDDNFPKLVDNIHYLTTDNNIYIDYDENNKKFNVLISLDGEYCVENGEDDKITFYQYEIKYDYKTTSFTQMDFKGTGRAQSSCSTVKKIMGDDYGTYN